MKDWKTRVAITAVAVSVAALHFFWPHLAIDGVTLGCLALALVPWLASVIRSIELPGVGKIELQALEKRMSKNEGAVASALVKSTTALEAATELERPPTSEGQTAIIRLAALASEYNTVRTKMRGGPERTERLSKIVARAIDLSNHISSDALDVESRLSSDDPGQRIIGYALAFARPEPNYFRVLAETVRADVQNGFGLYWGLLALNKTLAGVRDRGIVMDAHTTLKPLVSRVPSGSDREFELARLLEDLEHRIDALSE